MTSPKPVLLPYQQQWIADRSQVKVIEKSRRVGLTWGEAADTTLIAAAAGGQDSWYIGYNKDMALEFIETVGFWARAFNAAAGPVEELVLDDEDEDILAFRVRFASGHKVVALSSRPSNLRGKQGRVIIDEAAFHPALAELLKAALALNIWGGQVVIISTHDGVENPFNELVNDIRAGRKPFSLHRITFDEALADGLYQRICEKLSRAWSPEAEATWRAEIVAFYGDGAEEELFCIPRASAGAYFPSVLVEQRMDADVPVLRWEQPASFAELPEDIRKAETRDWLEAEVAPLLAKLNPHWPSFFGEDFGRSGDLTVIWPLQMLPNLTRWTPFLVELRNIPFRQQEQILFYIVDRLPRFTAGALDARGNGQYLAEVSMQRYGSGRIAQVMLSEPWYRDNMPRYKAALEDGTIVLPKDSDVLSDHRAVRMINGVPKLPDAVRGRGTDGKQRHGDAAIAGVLAYAASKMDVVEYDYTPAPRGPHRADDARGVEDEGTGRGLRGRGGY